MDAIACDLKNDLLGRIPYQFTSLIQLAVDLGFAVPKLRQKLKTLATIGMVETDEDDNWRRRDTLDNSGSRNPGSPDPNDTGNSNDPENSHLTYTELQVRQGLESRVRQTFCDKGRILAQIRDLRLYRDKFKSFEDYCKGVFGFGRNYANKQIAAVGIYDRLADALGADFPLPTCEAQCRPLSPLTPIHQQLAWELAVDLADGRVPTANKVKEAVRVLEMRSRPQKPNPMQAGDICTQKSGRWCVIARIEGAKCLCADWKGEKWAHFEDLKNLQLSEEQKAFMVELQKRLYSLAISVAPRSAVVRQNSDGRLHSAAENADLNRLNLSYFGKIRRGYLSERETKLLELLEVSHEETAS